MTDIADEKWATCPIGSCQRHRLCMYKPCRSGKGGNVNPMVRVRILVAVDADGKWIACGSSEHDAKDIIYIDDLKDGEIYHWVEADVPLPTEAGPAIEGIVYDSRND